MEKYRRQILRAAKDEFSEEGFKESSLESVALRAGLNRELSQDFRLASDFGKLNNFVCLIEENINSEELFNLPKSDNHLEGASA